MNYVCIQDATAKTLIISRGSEAQKRIQEIINLGSDLLSIIKDNPNLSQMNGMEILQRFIEEQATFNNEKQTWEAKGNKDIAADSLQSAYDTDVNKGLLRSLAKVNIETQAIVTLIQVANFCKAQNNGLIKSLMIPKKIF